MPLVSGVCRVASAPMLSHGGSRLNASKPEANPKTSCPKSLTKSFFLTKTKNLCWNEASGVSWTFLAFRSIRCYVNKQCSWKASLFSCPLFLWNLANLQKNVFDTRKENHTSHSKKIESPLKRLQHSAVSMARST